MAVFQTLVGSNKVAFVDEAGAITGRPGVELSDATSGEVLAGTDGLALAPASVARLAAWRDLTSLISGGALVIPLPTVSAPDNAALNAVVDVAANLSFVLGAVPTEYADKFFGFAVTFRNTSGGSVTVTPGAGSGGQPGGRIPTGQAAMAIAAGANLDVHAYYNPIRAIVVWTALPTSTPA